MSNFLNWGLCSMIFPSGFFENKDILNVVVVVVVIIIVLLNSCSFFFS